MLTFDPSSTRHQFGREEFHMRNISSHRMTSAIQSQLIEYIPAIVRRWAIPAALVAIIALGIAVRIVNITENPPGFFTDEAAIGYNAYTILTSGKDEYGESWPLLFRSFGDYKLPVFVYSVVPFVAIFGLTELAVRLAGATYGTLAIFTTFLLGSILFRRRSIGLAAALFLAITPWHIHYSRTGFGEMISFLPLLTLALYLFFRGVRQNGFWLASGVVFGLTLYTYRSAWVVVPPLMVVLAILYRRELMRNWRVALYSLGITATIALPILVHLATGEGDRSTQAGLFRLDLGPWEMLRKFVSQYFSHFSFSLLFDKGDDWFITRHYLPGFGHLYKVQLPLIILGILGLVLRPTREKMIVLVLLALFPLGGAISDISPISSRSILGTVVSAILSGYGLMILISGLNRLNRPYNQMAVVAVVASAALILSISFASYLDRYHSEYPALSAGYWGWQSGPKEIIEYYLSVQDQYEQLIMDGEFNGPHMFFLFYAPDLCKDRCFTGNTGSYDNSKSKVDPIIKTARGLN